ncbi:hypothetical protein O6H91_12G054600 [Diphasiastrum complanatum]|uniref:Uncharacterized protein n=2 Tax=Diphasiastrum complanatum TaxID=34168 RepID=A0ACC2C207_DIPCM|nr:hypothetical protein O6H91_12G054600 [Diphasiastrum complanatum]KAJ7536037.1 hypothetical protein O6H91_12G054600 [Diphasiastrum complanatum]
MGLVSSSLSRDRKVSDLKEICHRCSGVEYATNFSVSCEMNHPYSFNAYQGLHKQLFTTPSQSVFKSEPKRSWIFGKVLNPRSEAIIRWNRILLLSRAMGVAVDPVFFYLLVISQERSCLYIDGRFALWVTILRSASDIMLLWHIWLQLKLAYVCKESLVVGRGKLVWDAQKIVLHYLNFSGIIFDAFVILPIPQLMFWIFVPSMVKKGGQTSIMTTLLIVFIFQFIPKLFHLVLMVKRMQHATGYVFGTAWWGFALNLLAYLTAAHVAGSFWYLLAIQRVESCLHKACLEMDHCDLVHLGCSSPIRFRTPMSQLSPPGVVPNLNELTMQNSICNTTSIYQSAVPLVSTANGLQRMLYPIFWGLMTLSSFGNALTPSNHMLEVVFCITLVTCGLLLFTMLIGNIQVFLHSIIQKKEIMRFRFRDLEWWMRRRQLPTRLRHRVRLYERQRWAAMRGIDEDDMVRELPEGLRREIKRHLCLDLVRQVPFFDQMDEIMLDNICDRVKPILYIKGEVVIREGDPVLRMLFILRGHLQCEQRVSPNQTNKFMLGPGNFWGDELLSWCLRRPFVDQLPQSSATLTCLDSAETFSLGAQDLRYVTEHLRYKFANDKLTRTVRHHSFRWQTWAAVTIQLAWRRFKAHREALRALNHKKLSEQQKFLTRASSGLGTSKKDRLRLYTAMFISPKPNDLS